MPARSGHGKKKGCRSLPSFPSSSLSALRSQIGSRCILSRLASITKSQHERSEGEKFSNTRRGEKMCGISAQSECGDKVGDKTIIVRVGPADCAPSWCCLSYLSGFSASFIAVARLWETMCSPNEDLRAVFLSCSWQMYKRGKNCTKWYLATANPHPAPMCTEHQRPTHQHVRPIYNPAHVAPWRSPQKEARTHTGQSDMKEWQQLKVSWEDVSPRWLQNIATKHTHHVDSGN